MRAIFLFASAHAAKLPVFINMQLPQKGVLPKSVSGGAATADLPALSALFRLKAASSLRAVSL